MGGPIFSFGGAAAPIKFNDTKFGPGAPTAAAFGAAKPAFGTKSAAEALGFKPADTGGNVFSIGKVCCQLKLEI